MKLTSKHNFLAVDQWGNTYWIEKHPRKELMEQIGSSHASKIYIDLKDKSTHQVGYVIKGHWLDVFKIAPAFSR